MKKLTAAEKKDAWLRAYDRLLQSMKNCNVVRVDCERPVGAETDPQMSFLIPWLIREAKSLELVQASGTYDIINVSSEGTYVIEAKSVPCSWVVPSGSFASWGSFFDISYAAAEEAELETDYTYLSQAAAFSWSTPIRLTNEIVQSLRNLSTSHPED